MAGLDSIQDGGDVAVKANAKGQPVISGTVPLDATQTDTLLQNMQQMLEQRTGALPTLISGLKDTSAIGDQRAMVERDRQKLLEQQDIQSIRAQMAMYKSAQAQEQDAKSRYLGSNAPGAPGAMGTAGAPGAAAPAPTTMSGNIPVSAEQLAIENSLPRFTDKQESRRKYLAGRSTESTKKEFAPGMADIVDIYVPGEGNVQMTKAMAEKHLSANPNLQAIVNGKRVAAAPVVAALPNAAAPASDVSASAFDVTKSYGTPAKLLDNLKVVESSGNKFAYHPESKALGAYQFTPETLVDLHKKGIKFNPLDENEARAAADYYISQLAARNGGDYKKAMAQYGGFIKKDPTDYTNKVLKDVDTAAPAATTSVANRPAMSNETRSQYTQRLKGEDIIAESRIKSGEAKRDSAIDARDNSIETGNALNRIETTLNTPEGVRAVGVFSKPGVVAAFGKILSEGIQAGNFGAVKFNGLEDAVRNAGGDQKTIDAAQRLARDFAQMQLNIAKRDLKGQGAVSDNERRIVERVTGSTANSPEVLKDFTRWNRVRNEFDKNVGDALETWEAKFPNQSYAKFRQTPEYKKLEADYITKTDAMASKMGVAVGGSKPAASVDKTDDYLKQYRKPTPKQGS